MEKPFNFGTIANPVFFTNRREDIKSLTFNFVNGTNTILISPRRWGKSSLVWNIALRFKKEHPKIKFCFIDLYNIRSEEEFYTSYAEELIKATESKWSERVKSVKAFFTQLIPQIGLPVDPQNDITLSFEWKQLKKNPDEIIELAESICKAKKIKIVVCIDEFQNISYFEDHLAFQKKLRSHWQKHQHATYCIYGSKRNMMATLFENPTMPFYKFGDVRFLQKISRDHWIPFIIKRFSKTGKTISEELAEKIAATMEDHPYFVQQLAQECWQFSGKICILKNVDDAVESIIIKLSILYQRETDLLSNSQINFLKAMCAGEIRFTTAEVIEKYKLGSSANVIRIKKALEIKEIIDTIEPKIQFNDPLYRLWFIKFMV